MVLSATHPPVLINNIEKKIPTGNSTKIAQELDAFNFFFMEKIPLIRDKIYSILTAIVATLKQLCNWQGC